MNRTGSARMRPRAICSTCDRSGPALSDARSGVRARPSPRGREPGPTERWRVELETRVAALGEEPAHSQLRRVLRELLRWTGAERRSDLANPLIVLALECFVPIARAPQGRDPQAHADLLALRALLASVLSRLDARGRLSATLPFAPHRDLGRALAPVTGRALRARLLWLDQRIVAWTRRPPRRAINPLAAERHGHC